MYMFELIGLTILNLVKQALALPETLMITLQQRREQALRDHDDTERLDRIRNPSKYLGR